MTAETTKTVDNAKAQATADAPKAAGQGAEAHEPLNLLGIVGEPSKQTNMEPAVRLALAGTPSRVLSDGALTIAPIPELQRVAQAQNPGAEKTIAPIAPDTYRSIEQALPKTDSPAEYLNRVGDLINAKRRDPLDVAVKAIKDGSIIGFGEQHETVGNGFTQFGIDNMAQFKKAGMTHLAVELPSNLQGVLNDFQRTGELKIPDHLTTDDGKIDNSDAAKGALMLLSGRIAGDPQYASLLHAAQANGIKLVAVDTPDLYKDMPRLAQMTAPEQQAALNRFNDPKLSAERNNYMAEKLEQIVDGKLIPLPKGSPQAKVGFWVGASHVADTHGREDQPAGEQVRKWLEPKGQHYTSFFGQPSPETPQSGNPSSMWSLTPFMQRPAAVPTHESNNSPNALGRMKEAAYPNPLRKNVMSDWDYVMLFPR